MSSCHGLRGQGRRGSRDQLLDSGSLLLEIGVGGLLLLKKLTGGPTVFKTNTRQFFNRVQYHLFNLANISGKSFCLL
jgi:hypothetical protein